MQRPERGAAAAALVERTRLHQCRVGIEMREGVHRTVGRGDLLETGAVYSSEVRSPLAIRSAASSAVSSISAPSATAAYLYSWWGSQSAMPGNT